jgi:hypothetical protein
MAEEIFSYPAACSAPNWATSKVPERDITATISMGYSLFSKGPDWPARACNFPEMLGR